MEMTFSREKTDNKHKQYTDQLCRMLKLSKKHLEQGREDEQYWGGGRQLAVLNWVNHLGGGI